LKICQPDLPIALSKQVPATSWDTLAEARETAREVNAEGLMLKRLSSPYLAGRKKGDWWKWKVDPLTIDAVMIYAQAGHGRRATLFTDYTFAVKSGNELVPFTKAYSGPDGCGIQTDHVMGQEEHIATFWTCAPSHTAACV
jgi:DNA ligase-1